MKCDTSSVGRAQPCKGWGHAFCFKEGNLVCRARFKLSSYWTMKCDTSSVGRAQPCQGWGHEFEPRVSLQIDSCHRTERWDATLAQLMSKPS